MKIEMRFFEINTDPAEVDGWAIVVFARIYITKTPEQRFPRIGWYV